MCSKLQTFGFHLDLKIDLKIKNSEESCYLFDDSNIRQRVSTSAIAIRRTLFINLVNIVNIIKFSALSLDKPLGITYD